MAYTAKLYFMIQICNIIVTYMVSEYVTAMLTQYVTYPVDKTYVTICNYSLGHNVHTYL